MARPRLALLRNMSGCFKVAKKSVRNFDGVSYYNRRNSNVSPVCVTGVGLERLTFTFPLNRISPYFWWNNQGELACKVGNMGSNG